MIVINTVNQEAGGWTEVVWEKSLDSAACVCVMAEHLSPQRRTPNRNLAFVQNMFTVVCACKSRRLLLLFVLRPSEENKPPFRDSFSWDSDAVVLTFDLGNTFRQTDRKQTHTLVLELSHSILIYSGPDDKSLTETLSEEESCCL